MSEEDTPTPMLPAEESATASTRWWQDRLTRWIGGGVAVVTALIIASVFVPAQWLGRITPGQSIVDDGAVALRPGSARGTASRVTVSDIDVFTPEGEILFTTVAIDDQVTVWEWVEAEIDDDIELRTHESVFGTRSSSEQRTRNLQMMQVSKDSAVIAALEWLGVEAVDETGIGFASVVEGGPVDGLFEVGEVIVAIDGSLITSFESLRSFLDQVEPGDPAIVTLESAESLERREVDIVFGEHPDGVPGGFIGIADVVVRSSDVDLPFDLSIDSGTIGGPSAGLAFTLTIMDLLTEGELTGGHRVAVTGTISPGGSVGNVGGVGQKSAAANAEGVDLFIVPFESLEVATEHAGAMPVVGVSTLEEALEALASVGGDTTELALELPGEGFSQ